MKEIAIFGAGCFWGVEEAFRKLEGVLETSVGYTGGWLENPGYKEVCTNKTGHAEVVRVEFDPQQISYHDLLSVFWRIHDPTQYHRQGPDVGSQYRSVIFFTTPQQEQAAQSSLLALQSSNKYRNAAIVTEILPAATFYPAEEYHQKYLEKQGLSQCHF